jgi:hypothetical protein
MYDRLSREAAGCSIKPNPMGGRNHRRIKDDRDEKLNASVDVELPLLAFTKLSEIAASNSRINNGSKYR